MPALSFADPGGLPLAPCMQILSVRESDCSDIFQLQHGSFGIRLFRFREGISSLSFQDGPKDQTRNLVQLGRDSGLASSTRAGMTPTTATAALSPDRAKAWWPHRRAVGQRGARGRGIRLTS